MGRRLLCVLLVSSGAMSVRGQSAQIKAYLQQIAAYEVYIKDAEKGYRIVEDGIHTARDIKNGTFNLHSVFFGSLVAVNPAVRNYAEVAQVIAIQIATVESFQTAIASLKQSGELHGDELTYIGKVYSGVVDAGLEDVSALIAVITSGTYSMDDGERLRNIDRIYNDVVKRYQFARTFSGQCILLDRSRSAESGDIDAIRSLYGIK